MKKLLIVSLGMMFTAASLSSHAATEVSSLKDEKAYGYVSVTGESSLDSLTASLARKADEAGASRFYITSAGGKNKLHGSAVLLK
ncbi:DUF1471 domain-containing protein [Serratia grimesii]|uniref:DUF1471 domain-containing protein n=1 Tax=Serratia grimesii TaxID=82995 RepID=UPI0022406968|nr:DUF1471 domain-containing protein [Serratia grimesii]